MPSTPTATYRDGMTVGQLARHWQRDQSFVRDLINDGALQTDERGCVTITSLRDYYRSNPDTLNQV